MLLLPPVGLALGLMVTTTVVSPEAWSGDPNLLGDLDDLEISLVVMAMTLAVEVLRMSVLD